MFGLWRGGYYYPNPRPIHLNLGSFGPPKPQAQNPETRNTATCKVYIEIKGFRHTLSHTTEKYIPPSPKPFNKAQIGSYDVCFVGFGL